MAQDQHAPLVVPRRDELLRHQVHPVVQAGDHAQLRRAVILVNVLGLMVLHLEHDGRVARTREALVDPRRHRSHAPFVFLVLPDAGAGRRRDLNEGEPADPFRLHLQQAFDRTQPLLDPLGVIEPVHTDADRVTGRQAVALPHVLAALLDGLAHQGRGRWPLDRDRVTLDRGRLAPIRDGEHLPIHPRFQQAIDGVHEVVAVEPGVEPENAAAQHAVEQLLAPRADGERFRIRPGNVPERDDRGRRQRLLDHPGQQGEMVVLDKHDGIGGLRLVDHGARERPVHPDVLLPVRRPEDGAHVGDVTQRPQSLVCEAIVVAGFLVLAQPDAAELIRRLLRRHAHAVVGIHDVPVGGPTTVGEPRAGTGAHDRLQGRDQAARRSPDDDRIVPADVDVRLPVRHHDHLVAAEIVAHDRAQRLGRPRQLLRVSRSVVGFEVANEGAQVSRDGPKLGRVGPIRRAEQAFASQQRPQALHPAAPAQLRDDDRDQRDRRAEADKEEEHVLSRFLAAARHEAHVVHEHQAPDRRSVGFERPDRDQDRTVGAGQQVPRRAAEPAEGAAADLGRQRRGRDRLARGRRAEPDREEAFVLRDAGEELHHPGPVSGTQQILHGFLNGVRDEAGANVEIPDEPPQGQLVHERHHRVRERGERDQQRNDEAKRETHLSVPYQLRCLRASRAARVTKAAIERR